MGLSASRDRLILLLREGEVQPALGRAREQGMSGEEVCGWRGLYKTVFFLMHYYWM